MQKQKPGRGDYYSLLGVSRDATTAAIRRAFRKLARQMRPERGEGDALRELQVAYETLANAESRRRYDETLGTSSPSATGFDDRLSWSFVRSPAVGDLRRPLRPATVTGEIVVSPSEAVQGGVLSLGMPVLGACPSCQGTGGTAFDCGRCGGEGRLQRRMPVPVHIPPGVRDGAVFQVVVDEPSLLSVFLTVHIRQHP
ncbi:MAG TPA: DnaJ domain-containing protein [Vicinamibacteria bacterium]|nr:DnaJ domain-containing protein [Vicinamibacteria bacterium]